MRKVSVSVSILACVLLAACSKSPFLGKWAGTAADGSIEFRDDGSCTLAAPNMPSGVVCKWNKTGDSDMEVHMTAHAEEMVWKGHVDKDTLTLTGTKDGQGSPGPLHKQS
jgi:hypothetical protein